MNPIRWMLAALATCWMLQAAEPTASAPVENDTASELTETAPANALLKYYDAHIFQARKEKKPMVLAIFSSDEKRERSAQLVGSPEWQTRIVDKYAILPLDLRKDLMTQPGVMTMVTELMKTYMPARVPALIFIDDKLIPIGQIHSTPSNDVFFAKLDKIEQAAKQRVDHAAKCKELKQQQAKLLDQALESAFELEAPVTALRDDIDEIVELDADNAAGLHAKYLPIAQLLDADAAILGNRLAHAEALLNEPGVQKLTGRWQQQRIDLLLLVTERGTSAEKVTATLESGLALPDVPKEVKQKWMARAAETLERFGDTVKADALAKKAIELDPESDFAKGLAAAVPVAATKPTDRPLTTADGKAFDLAALKGKVVLVEFWRGANPLSQIALRTLSEIATEHKDKGVVCLAVHVGGMDDAKEEIPADIQNVIWLNDPDGSLESAFDVSRAPTTIILDKEGKKAHLLIGLNLYSKRAAEKKLEALAK